MLIIEGDILKLDLQIFVSWTFSSDRKFSIQHFQSDFLQDP